MDDISDPPNVPHPVSNINNGATAKLGPDNSNNERVEDTGKHFQTADNNVGGDDNNEGSTNPSGSNGDKNADQEVQDRPACALKDAINRSKANDPSLAEIRLHIIDDLAVTELASALANNTCVTYLTLRNNLIGPEGAASVASMLRRNESLHHLNLEGNIGPYGAASLASALRENETLQELMLHDSNVGPEGAALLTEVLQDSSSLQVLYLHRNNIGDNGAVSLAEALWNNVTLQVLYLNQNNIGASGAASLAEALRNNVTLQELYLGDNPIGEEGVTSISKALWDNTSLQVLDLRGTEIEDDGAASLAEAIRNSTTLKEIYLRRDRIGNEGAALLASAMEVNTALTVLDLDVLKLDQSVREKIRGFIARNQDILQINERKTRLQEQHDMVSAKGFVDALVELSNEEAIFDSVMFEVFHDIPEVVDGLHFMGAN